MSPDQSRSLIHDYPDYEVVLEANPKIARASLDGTVIAESERSVLLLETVVSDSETAVAPIVAERQRVDQAMEGYGSRPSASWIDATCRAAGFETVHDISNPAGNWKTGKFDWEPRGEGAWRRDGYNFRKMWVCEKAARPSANRPT